MARRTSLEKKVEILENSIENIKPTILMRNVNMSWQPLLQHLEELKNKGLIEEITMGEEEHKKDRRTKVNYRATATGMHVVNMMKVVRKSID